MFQTVGCPRILIHFQIEKDKVRMGVMMKESGAWKVPSTNPHMPAMSDTPMPAIPTNIGNNADDYMYTYGWTADTQVREALIN